MKLQVQFETTPPEYAAGIVQELTELGISTEQGVLQGKRVLALLGIVEADAYNDTDLLVHPAAYEEVRKRRGWSEGVHPITGDTFLRDDDGRYDIWQVWYDGAYRRTLDQQWPVSHRVGELRVACITDIQAYKCARIENGLEDPKQDPEDLLAIEAYKAVHPGFLLHCLARRHGARQVVEGGKDLAAVTLDTIATASGIQVARKVIGKLAA